MRAVGKPVDPRILQGWEKENRTRIQHGQCDQGLQMFASVDVR